jgi:NAD(P)H-dependent FMN reductase
VNLLAVVGAVTPPGRLDAAVRFAAETAAARPGVTASVLSLGEHRISFADGRPLERFTDDTARVVGALVAADAVLLASPVYRGSLTGALKNLLDLTPVEALRAKPVGIVAMGATAHHYLGVDWHLRAVLAGGADERVSRVAALPRRQAGGFGEPRRARRSGRRPRRVGGGPAGSGGPAAASRRTRLAVSGSRA